MSLLSGAVTKIRNVVDGAIVRMAQQRIRSGRYEDAAYVGVKSWAMSKLQDHFLRWKFPKNAWYHDQTFLTKIYRDGAVARFLFGRREFVAGLPYFFEGGTERQIRAFYEIFRHIPLYGKKANK